MENKQHQEANEIPEQTKASNRLLLTLTAKPNSDFNQLSLLEMILRTVDGLRTSI